VVEWTIRIGSQTLCPTYFMTFLMFNCGRWHLNQKHQLFLGIPSRNGVGLIYVNFTTFVISWCNNMDKPHSCIINVQVMIATSFSFVGTPFQPICLDLVWPLKWPQKEFKGIFHDLLALHKEQVLLSTTSTTSFSVWFVHFFMIVTTKAQLTFATFFTGYFSRIDGTFFLFTIG
jgi:hypothetical protein